MDEAIPDDEKVVRAIKSPFHISKKGDVKHTALRPPLEDSVVSVIRHAMGDNFCKDQGKKVVEGDPDAQPDPAPAAMSATYVGLLPIRSGHIRAYGSAVVDAREDFCGHAHIDHGIVMPPRGVPLDPAVGEAFRERCKSIIAGGKYECDPAPDQPGWSGPPL